MGFIIPLQATNKEMGYKIMLTLEYLRSQYKGVAVEVAIEDLETRIFINEMQSRMDFEFNAMLKKLLKEFKNL